MLRGYEENHGVIPSNQLANAPSHKRIRGCLAQQEGSLASDDRQFLIAKHPMRPPAVR